MNVFIRRAFLLLIDIILIVSAVFLSFLILNDGIPSNYLINLFRLILIANIICIPTFFIFDLYNSLWKYASIKELMMVLASASLVTIIFYFVNRLFNTNISLSFYIVYYLLLTYFIGSFRMSLRVFSRLKSAIINRNKNDFKRVMIIGAGDAGVLVINELKRHPEIKLHPVAIIDDDISKHRSSIMGVRIYGGREKIQKIATTKNIHEIIIAIPSAKKDEITSILNDCKKTKCKLRILPGLYELINESVLITQLRDVQIEDLLGREPINVDIDEISSYLKDEVVLVTGGGGSIGSELCRQIANLQPKKLIVLDIYENNAYELQQELVRGYADLNLEVVISSVRDRTQLEYVFDKFRPGVVFHAAAHKHVPLMEANPTDAIKNNVFGTLNVAECADKFRVKKFVLISTDKAVNPTNIMGATKRVAEMIIQAMNHHSKTDYVAVRFGNVLGSNGSVIPLFKKQILQGGPITVTHPEVNRFFMTIPEAVTLVIQAGTLAKGGEIFILDMGNPVKIIDLARDLIRLSGLEPDVDIKIEFSGLRPGEKLYEELLMDSEGLTSTKYKKIFIGKPIFHDINILRNDLNKLKFLLNNPNEKLLECLQEIVPSYKSNDEDYEVLVKKLSR